MVALKSDNIGRSCFRCRWTRNQQQWSGLRVWAWWCVNVGSGTKQQKSFYISSLEDDALVLAHAVPSHWGIEFRTLDT